MKGIPCTWLRILNTVKMVIRSKLIHRVNASLIKIPGALLQKLTSTSQASYGILRDSDQSLKNIAKNSLEKNKTIENSHFLTSKLNAK